MTVLTIRLNGPYFHYVVNDDKPLVEYNLLYTIYNFLRSHEIAQNFSYYPFETFQKEFHRPILTF